MFKISFVSMLLFACTISVFGQKRSDAEIQSMQERLKSMPADTNKVILLIDIGNSLRDQLPSSRDSVLAFLEQQSALLNSGDANNIIANRIKKALPYFEQGTVLSKKLKYDSGVIKSMIGSAETWIDLVQLMGITDGSDSVERNEIRRHCEEVLEYVKPKQNARQTADFYFKVADLIPIQFIGNKELLLSLYDSSVVYYHAAKDVERESLALMRSAMYHVETNRIAEGRALFKESIDVALAGNEVPPPYAYSWLGMDLNQQGDYKSGLIYLQKAFNILAKDSISSDPLKVNEFVTLCLYMGIAHHRMKNVPLSLQYNYRGLRAAERNIQESLADMVTCVGNLVVDLNVLKRSPEALALLQRIEKKYPALKSHYSRYITASSFMAVYMKLNNVPLANKYADELVKFCDETTVNAARRVGYFRLAAFYLDSKQYDKARKYAVLFNATLTNQIDYIIKGNTMLFRIDSARGDFKSALAYYQRARTLNDSLLNESKLKELERLNVEFDTKNKEQQLILANKDKEISKQELQKAGIHTRIVIVGLILTVGILILVYRLYRVKKKAGELLQKQRDEISWKNSALEKAIQEKEWLLKEVHHRVKNNLYMISGLLSMQAKDLKDDIARTAIISSQNRVQAMSMVHQKLLSNNRLSPVDFSSYLNDLIDHLKISYDTERIFFKVAVESIVVDTRTAISLGLISNEAITNCIKYAFPQGRNGTVTITLVNTPESLCKLVIQDNGVGISKEIMSQSKSIGLTLIEGISEELDGNLKIDSSKGFSIEITFPYHEFKVEGGQLV